MEQGQNHQESPLVSHMRQQFDLYRKQGFAAMFVCASAWGPPGVSYVGVPSRAWPWGVLDSSDAMRKDVTMTAVIAFDLRREFDAQMPAHMRQIDVFECFWMNPLINIPDRTGVVPEDRNKAFQKEALQEPPKRPAPATHLRLVKR